MTYTEDEFNQVCEEYKDHLDECVVCEDCGPTIRTVSEHKGLTRKYYLCDICYRERVETGTWSV